MVPSVVASSTDSKWYPDSRGHESQAVPYVLGGSRVTPLQQPNFCFQPTGCAGGWGKEDFSAVTHVIEKRIGRRITQKPST